MTLADVGDIAQPVIAVVTLVGIIASIAVSVRAIREVQEDRRLSRLPYLAFDIGGHEVSVSFVQIGSAVPGIEPGAAKLAFPDVHPDAESVRPQEDFGVLRNFGTGPALEINVTWVAGRISLAGQEFAIDDAKRKEPRYSGPMNRMPTIPSHVFAGEEAAIPRLPTFIVKDFDRAVGWVEGQLLIECRDVFGNVQVTQQEFRLTTDYPRATVIATFGNILRVSPDAKSARRWLNRALLTGMEVVLPGGISVALWPRGRDD